VLCDRLDGGDLLGDLPLPVQHEQDAGRYLTSALVAVRDPRTGATNLSINRLQATGPAEVRALLLPGRLRQILAAHEAAGEDLPVALCLGVDPLLALASQSPATAGLDDLEVASALHPAPLPVTAVEGLPTPVPARAEMLLVGRFRCGVRQPEGPFGEFPRTYGPGGPAPVIELATRWSRDEPVLQTILSGGREHFWLGGLPRETRIVEAVRAAGPDVAAVRLTEGGSCRMHAVLSLRGGSDGSARHAAMAAFTAVPSVKLVVVVDDDVNVFDDEEVEWAVATRMQADRDLLVVPGTVGSSLDPSSNDGVTAKLALDATVFHERRDRFARMRSASAGSSALRTYISALEGDNAVR
jgi:2,5-furandicarboxylate decarboxylase 1